MTRSRFFVCLSAYLIVSWALIVWFVASILKVIS